MDHDTQFPADPTLDAAECGYHQEEQRRHESPFDFIYEAPSGVRVLGTRLGLGTWEFRVVTPVVADADLPF